ncbi:MAG: phosphoribosyltransferase family protein [Promethearchaeati archaeon SRVP18_Atabeyarchaeia-1]
MFPPNVEDDPSLRDRAGVFKSRTHAGELLAERLRRNAWLDQSAMVVAIPSGGVPVGYVIAGKMQVPLDVILVRKIPIPWEPEAGFGSVTFDGSIFLNDSLVRTLGLSKTQIDQSIRKSKEGLDERARKFLTEGKDGLLQDVQGRTVILVDDGIASGYTMLASAESIKKRRPGRIVVAAPTGSLKAINLVSPSVDELLCLNVRSGYSFAVADAYEEWYDVPEEEAIELVRASRLDADRRR